MTNDWIIDVLSDLRSFADANGLAHLADQLDATRLVALAELASHKQGAVARGGAHDVRGRTYPGGPRTI